MNSNDNLHEPFASWRRGPCSGRVPIHRLLQMSPALLSPSVLTQEDASCQER